MADFEVPISANGIEMLVPVSGVETEKDAYDAVQKAISENKLDMSAIMPEKPGGIPDVPGAGIMEATASVAEGAGQAVRKGAEFGLMIRDALTPATFFPEDKKKTQQMRRELRVENAAARDEDAALLKAAFGSKAEFSPLLEAVGEGIMFAPLAPVGQGSTFTRAVLGNMGQGAVGMGVSAADTMEKLSDGLGRMTVGSLIGLGASVFQIPKGVKAFTGREFSKELDRPIAQAGLALEKEMQKLTGDPDWSFTVAQLAADNPWLQGFELGARSRESLGKQNKNTESIVKLLLRRGDTMDEKEFAEQLAGTFADQIKSIRGTASATYKMSLDDLVEQTGDRLVLDGESYLDDLTNYIAELDDARRLGSAATEELQKHRTVVDELVYPFRAIPAETEGRMRVINRRTGQVSGEMGAEEAEVVAIQANKDQGGLTSEDVIEVLRGHNQLLAGERSLGKDAPAGSAVAVGRRLKASLMTALDGTDDAAIESIKNMQSAYAFEQGRVHAIQSSAIGKLFKLNSSDDAMAAMLEEPEKAVARLAKLTPNGQAKAKELLMQVDGGEELIEKMKKSIMRTVVEKSQDNSTSVGMSTTSINKLASNLTGKGGSSSNTMGKVGLGLFEPWEQAEIISAAESLRRMKALYVTDIARDAAGEAGDVGINVASRNIGFVTRLIVRRLAKSANMEHLMIDPKARQALIAMGKEGPGSLNNRLAIAYLATFVGAHEQRKRQEQMKKAQGILSRK